MANASPSSNPPSASALPTVPWESVERFVSQLTHDVRNGLNALELQLTFLGELCTDPEAASEVKQLRRTLGDVSRQLQAVRTLTGSASPQTLDYPAGELFDDLRERFEHQHPEAASAAQWKIEMSDANLTVDPELLIVSLLELLNNAVRFGGDSPQITVSVRASDSRTAQIELREIKPEGAPPIDTAKWGAEPLRSTRRGAYGLGLFRARRVIEAQGGVFHAGYDSAERTLTTTIKIPLGTSAVG